MKRTTEFVLGLIGGIFDFSAQCSLLLSEESMQHLAIQARVKLQD